MALLGDRHNGQWAAPSLEQAVELAAGILPRELETWDEVPGRAGALLKTPQAAPWNQGGSGGEQAKQLKKLLPTPLAKDGSVKHPDRGPNSDGGKTLGQTVKLLPTPTASLANYREEPEGWEQRSKHKGEQRAPGGESSLPLPVAVKRLLPTPRASKRHTRVATIEEGLTRGESLPSRVAKLLPTPAARDNKGAGTQREGGPDLPLAVDRLLPTPTESDQSGSRRATARQESWTSKEGTTLTDAALLSRGETTREPSDDGSSSSGGLVLNPWFSEWMMGAPEGWSEPSCLLSATEFSSRPAGSSEHG